MDQGIELFLDNSYLRAVGLLLGSLQVLSVGLSLGSSHRPQTFMLKGLTLDCLVVLVL